MVIASIALFVATLVAPAPASRPEATGINDEACIACHATVGAKRFAASSHGTVGCSGCHADVSAVPHRPRPRTVDCGQCHSDAAAAWNASRHAIAIRSGIRGAACADCHGPVHEILPSADAHSRTFRTAVPRTCARCHAQKFVVERAGLSTQPAISYQQSVHGREVARGSRKAAVCTDCHEPHAIRPANDPLSDVFKFNVARTCGQCHAAISAQYFEGIHGRTLARGNWSAPVCTDCHGIHAISRAADRTRGARASCARCHEGVQLTREFAVPGNRVASYEASYHGLASRLGSPVAADCASCHGGHRILPSSDPRSAINPKNLPATCGKCHRGAEANFARGKVHLVPGERGDLPSKIAAWIRWIYTAVIVCTVAFMIFHNFLVWRKKAQARRRERGATVVRMNLNQRIQHMIMFITFFVLAVSGFALAWPASLFAKVFGSNELARMLVHRATAVVMIALGIYHIGYMTLTREGRKGLRDLRPAFSDGKALFAVLRYYLGLSSTKPAFPRFGYAEKLEYWAGAWGTIVMSITGLMIWYAVTVATWIPRWWIDIATLIHFYEAVLATLSILVWHFYHVIFDPDVYPMNWSWLDGRMSEKLYREEHALDTEASPQDRARGKV